MLILFSFFASIFIARIIITHDVTWEKSRWFNKWSDQLTHHCYIQWRTLGHFRESWISCSYHSSELGYIYFRFILFQKKHTHFWKRDNYSLFRCTKQCVFSMCVWLLTVTLFFFFFFITFPLIWIAIWSNTIGNTVRPE